MAPSQSVFVECIFHVHLLVEFEISATLENVGSSRPSCHLKKLVILWCLYLSDPLAAHPRRVCGNSPVVTIKTLTIWHLWPSESRMVPATPSFLKSPNPITPMVSLLLPLGPNCLPLKCNIIMRRSLELDASFRRIRTGLQNRTKRPRSRYATRMVIAIVV